MGDFEETIPAYIVFALRIGEFDTVIFSGGKGFNYTYVSTANLDKSRHSRYYGLGGGNPFVLVGNGFLMSFRGVLYGHNSRGS